MREGSSVVGRVEGSFALGFGRFYSVVFRDNKSLFVVFGFRLFWKIGKSEVRVFWYCVFIGVCESMATFILVVGGVCVFVALERVSRLGFSREYASWYRFNSVFFL